MSRRRRVVMIRMREMVNGFEIIERWTYLDEGLRVFTVRDVYPRTKTGKLYRMNNVGEHGYVSLVFSTMKQVNRHFRRLTIAERWVLDNKQ